MHVIFDAVLVVTQSIILFGQTVSDAVNRKMLNYYEAHTHTHSATNWCPLDAKMMVKMFEDTEFRSLSLSLPFLTFFASIYLCVCHTSIQGYDGWLSPKAENKHEPVSEHVQGKVYFFQSNFT